MKRSAKSNPIEDVRILLLELAELCQQPGAFFGGLVGQFLFKQDIDRGDAGGAGERIASEGGAVQERVFFEHFPDLRRAHETTQRHDAAAQSFTQTEDIGDDAPVFAGEVPTAPAHAGLDFVEDQQHAVFIAGLPRPEQIVGRGHDRARLALNGFKDDGGDLFAE
jgi:hypothetical protein